MSSKCVDVFICGGGPVGLFLTYQMARLGLSTYTIEKLDKSEHGNYGRAATFHPRSLEMLDQLDLVEDIQQSGFISRQGTTFRDGQRVPGRGPTFLAGFTDTNYDYSVNLRQKYTEEIFKEHAEKAGGKLYFKEALQTYTILEDTADEYKVEVIVQQEDGSPRTIRAKYLIGADGGRSTVRKLAKIAFDGERTGDRWVRIEGIVKTDMPDSRLGIGSLQSKEYGNILWSANDHGTTRVGYALTPEISERYNGNLTLENAITEAKKAVAPFTIDFERVDWFTVYNIGQHVASRYSDRGRVFLAGDAAHTHSSAGAQGLNTGIYDAVNLGWKLAGVLKGQLFPHVLETYNSERRPVAQHLIKLDRIASALASGTVPEELQRADGAKQDSNVLYSRHFKNNGAFTSGLGVYYEADGLLNRATPLLNLDSGHRGPDVAIHKPGSRQSTRLFDITKNTGKYWILVFAGQPENTRESLKSLRTYIDSETSFVKKLKNNFNFCTIIAGPGRHGHADEYTHVEGFGRRYFDPDESAHGKYGIPGYQGGVVCLRPDGIIGFATLLNDGPAIGEYFRGIVRSKNPMDDEQLVHR